MPDYIQWWMCQQPKGYPMTDQLKTAWEKWRASIDDTSSLRNISRDAFYAGHASRDAEVAELEAKNEEMANECQSVVDSMARLMNEKAELEKRIAELEAQSMNIDQMNYVVSAAYARGQEAMRMKIVDRLDASPISVAASDITRFTPIEPEGKR